MSKSVEQLARLAIELPLAADGGVSVLDLAQRLSVSPRQVVADLKLASYCGLPGGLPGDLIEVDFDDLANGWASVHNPTQFDRPLALTVGETAALRLALMTLRQVSPDDQAEAVEGLIDLLSHRLADIIEVRLSVGSDAVRQSINQAISQRRGLALVYNGLARGTTTRPLVDPQRLWVEEGVAYLRARDRASGQARTYRLDRIEQAELADSSPEVEDGWGADSWSDRLAAADSVCLTVTTAGAWVAEYYNALDARPEGDHWRVILPVVNHGWLQRLLAQLGPDLLSAEPPDDALVAADRAQAALELYGLAIHHS
ncbi:MAG: WYL domain-containing protein [Propionibacteriaceae bacterium]|jgi:proteasome accessory factor C|nr:WYL domain-containing protein [Propionibacteriaceae bacterium]